MVEWPRDWYWLFHLFTGSLPEAQAEQDPVLSSRPVAMNPYGVLVLPTLVLAGVLLLFHLWYDFHVQGAYISAGKRTSNLLLSVHAMTWTLCVSVPLYAVGTLSVEQFLFLLSSHWLMDWTKCHKMKEGERSLVIDQVVHVITLGVCLWAW